MKPTADYRRYLVIAGSESHDPLHVMNAFYNSDPNCDNDRVASEYWQCKVAILCERICRAEKYVGQLRTELAFRHMAESRIQAADKLILKLLDIASGPAAMNSENQDDINAICAAAQELKLFRDAFATTATRCDTFEDHHWEHDPDDDSAVCRKCGERDSSDVL